MPRHRIVSKHLLRSRARARLHELERLKAAVNISKSAAAVIALKAAKVRSNDILEVARAGRIRARWVVRVRA